jgi:hypothetical protein
VKFHQPEILSCLQFNPNFQRNGKFILTDKTEKKMFEEKQMLPKRKKIQMPEIFPHYENKFTKTFRHTDILHTFTKFWFGVFYLDFFVTNQLNVSEFLPSQIRKILISY